MMKKMTTPEAKPFTPEPGTLEHALIRLIDLGRAKNLGQKAVELHRQANTLEAEAAEAFGKDSLSAPKDWTFIVWSTKAGQRLVVQEILQSFTPKEEDVWMPVSEDHVYETIVKRRGGLDCYVGRYVEHDEMDKQMWVYGGNGTRVSYSEDEVDLGMLPTNLVESEEFFERPDVSSV